MDQNASQKSDSLLDALLRVSITINTLQELDPLLENIMDIAVEAIGAERGFILLIGDTGAPVVRIARNMSDQTIRDVTKISNSIVFKVLKSGKMFMVYDTQSDGRHDDLKSVIVYQIRSVACVPLKIKERPIGAIYLDSINRRSGFTQTSIPFLTIFANQAAIAIENAQLYQRLQEENRQLLKQAQKANNFAGIIGNSPKMKQVFDIINSVLDSDATVLIQGESGTGKELVARAIHYHGVRRKKPYVALFCGSLPESLLESELFGHKKGSFTGAISDKKGLFEAADTGTLFLDEIGDISMNLQTQLLRVLQEGEIKKVGENNVQKVDVRIIAATNKNLQKEIEKGHFREDLYYRLNVIDINLPPLQERNEDITLLAQHFLEKFTTKYKKDIRGYSPEALETMLNYPWPGNVRELENKIEKAVVLAKGEIIDLGDLQPKGSKTPMSLPSGITVEEMIRRFVLQTLDETGGNITHTAEQLGVSRRWVQYKQKQWKHAKN